MMRGKHSTEIIETTNEKRSIDHVIMTMNNMAAILIFMLSLLDYRWLSRMFAAQFHAILIACDQNRTGVRHDNAFWQNTKTFTSHSWYRKSISHRF